MVTHGRLQKQQGRKPWLAFICVIQSIALLIALKSGNMRSPVNGYALPEAALSVAPATPHLLFFMHIPKTGGTTVERYLQSLKERDYTLCDVPSFLGDIQGDFQTIFQGDSLACTIYHKEAGLWHLDQLHERTSLPVLGLTFLRDPSAAVFSAVAHGVSKGRHTVKEALQSYANGTCPGEACTAKGYNLYNRQMEWLTRGQRDTSYHAVVKRLESLFFIGITEYMAASKCLLDYQLGHFNASACSVKCGAGTVDTARFNVRTESTDGSALTFEYEDISIVQGLIRQDLLVYHAGLQIFLSRVHALEQLYGITMLCETI